jgi:flagellar hook-associated protein FlgK
VLAYSIGVSGMAAGQAGLAVIGQNIANASTRGYHRQRVELAGLTLDGRTGLGVGVQTVSRAESPFLWAAILTANGESARVVARLDSQRQAQGVFAPGAGSVGDLMDRFFNELELLTTRPEDPTQRRLVLSAASTLAGRFNAAAADLDHQRSDLRDLAAQTVGQINDLTPRIADLNARIVVVEAGGQPANDLRDQRDLLIDRLSQLVDVRTQVQPGGVMNVIGPGGGLVVGTVAQTLAVSTDAAGNLVMTSAGSTTPLAVRGGQLGGIVEEHNRVIPEYQSRLDTLARTLIQQVNAIHATGLNANGPVTTLAGLQPVADPTVPLASAGLALPLQAGQLVVSVTDLATGRRTLSSVAIDPATQSLQDVAGAITAGTGGRVQAAVDPATGTLRFQAQSGFAFDFAGRLPTDPPAVAMNGTAVPTVAGAYTGSGNDAFSFQVVGTGTVGTSAGLQLEVRNGAGSVIATLNVGAGYTPGTALAVADGVTVSLSAGTTDNGTFAVPVTGQPDTAGLLAALGVGGLLTGSGAGDVGVRADLLADPSQLNLSRSGQPGDATNVERLAAVRDLALLGGGTQTVARFYDALVGDAGTEVENLDDQQTAQEGIRQTLVAREQATIGIDVNEEAVSLVQFQRMIEAASRYLSVVNTAVDAVLDIVR